MWAGQDSVDRFHTHLLHASGSRWGGTAASASSSRPYRNSKLSSRSSLCPSRYPLGISAWLRGGGRGEPLAAGEGQGEGRASGDRGTLGLLPRTISMILVFLPVFFFMVKIYCASTTPPTSAHTLALATAPILATAVLSMVAVPGAPGAAAGKSGCALGVGEEAGSCPTAESTTTVPHAPRRPGSSPAVPRHRGKGEGKGGRTVKGGAGRLESKRFLWGVWKRNSTSHRMLRVGFLFSFFPPSSSKIQKKCFSSLLFPPSTGRSEKAQRPMAPFPKLHFPSSPLGGVWGGERLAPPVGKGRVLEMAAAVWVRL